MILNTLYGIFRNKLIIASALAFLIMLSFMFFRAITGFGPILAAGLVSYLSAWLTVKKAKEKEKENRSLAAALGYYLMTAAFSIWLISFVFIEFNIVSQGRLYEEAQGEYVIVLGAGLRGEEPSVSLSSRLQKASEYLKENQNLRVIVSGGQGKDEKISEAEAMKRYLMGAGIEAGRIIAEDRSTSTRENLVFSKAILETNQIPPAYRIIVITSDYHAFRTKILAKSIGMEISVLPSKTSLYVYISGCVREYFAVLDTYAAIMW